MSCSIYMAKDFDETNSDYSRSQFEALTKKFKYKIWDCTETHFEVEFYTSYKELRAYLDSLRK